MNGSKYHAHDKQIMAENVGRKLEKPIKCAIKLYYMKANVKSTETIADITAFLHVMSSEDFHLIVPYSLTV